MQLTKLFNEFFESEKGGGVILVCCAAASLLLTNSIFGEAYLSVWQLAIAGHGAGHWINDGLMTIFFLLIGLELEREIYLGELSSVKNAALPIAAAIGGMLIPAGIFLLFNHGTPTQAGAGIPMATDIAFAVGILSIIGNRVPAHLRVMLIALAVIDDLGAIIVIAVFYASALSWASLGAAAAIFAILIALNRLKVNHLLPYLVGGAAIWYCMLHSGVHPTITGVLLAFAVPFGDGGEKSPSYRLQDCLHKPVAFLVLPLFALANTCLVFDGSWSDLAHPNSMGIYAGLVAGKPLGILLFSFAVVAAGFCALPDGVKWRHVLGVGFLGGIGFTMSIFITLLAYDQPGLVVQSKIAILLASLTSGIIGFVWLRMTLTSAARK